MKVSIVGGGPGGLYLASLLRERVPEVEVTLYERNPEGATYGFGVVFSEPTMSNLREQDPPGFADLFATAARWPGIDIRIRGEDWRCEGNGFSAIERRRLLHQLSDRAARAGTTMRYETTLSPESEQLEDADLVVAADGANSAWRALQAENLGSTIETASAKFIWFGTDKVLDGMTFLFERNKHGWFAAHAYPYNDQSSTFVVETDEETWRRAGLDGFDTTQPPGPSDEVTAAYMEKLFAKHLDGGRMIVNNSRWANFRTVRTRSWRVDDRTVLLGDAAHTAHFSVGSGTKMALEDALELARQIESVVAGSKGIGAALLEYEQVRRRDVRRIQDVARPSLSWWEHFGEYADLPPAQFTFHFLTRSGRVGRRRLTHSDPAYIERALGELLGNAQAPALNTPLTVSTGHTLTSRVLGIVPSGGRAGVRAALDGENELTVVSEPSPDNPLDAVHAVPFFDDERGAIWCSAPSHPDQVDAFISHNLPAMGGATLIIIDAAPFRESNISAAADALVAQQRVAEILKLRHGFVVALVRRECTADEAASLVISGRADAIAVSANRVAGLLEEELASYV